MKIDLNKLDNATVIIDQTHQNFKGTDLETDNFSIEVNKLSRADLIDIAGNPSIQDTDGNIKNGQYSKALFIASLGNITGYTDTDGNELEDGEMLKMVVWELSPDAVIKTIQEVITSNVAKEDEKKSDLEALATDIQDGQQTVE